MIKEKYYERLNEIAIDVVNTNIAGIRRKDIERKGLRVYKDGFVGVAGGIGNIVEAELEKQAIEDLSEKTPYPYALETDTKERYINTNEIMDWDCFKDEMEEVLSILRKNHPDFIFFDKAKLIRKEFALSNDQGLGLYHDDKYINLRLLFREKNSTNMFDGGITALSKQYNRAEHLNLCSNICNAVKNPVDLPPKEKMPVIFLSSENIILNKFYSDLNGMRFGSGSSIFSQKMGKKLFSEAFTLEQSRNPGDELPLIMGADLIPFFDTEGKTNDNYRYSLIKNGEIISPYTDKKISAQYNLPYTGSAIGSYDDIPRIGCDRLRIKETGKTIKELLGGEKGILAIVPMGGDFSSDGSFATPVQFSLYFDGENILGVLPPMQVSSNIYDMFGKDYRGASTDSPFSMLNSRCVVMDMKVSKL